jgi:hypothetical protein
MAQRTDGVGNKDHLLHTQPSEAKLITVKCKRCAKCVKHFAQTVLIESNSHLAKDSVSFLQ